MLKIWENYVTELYGRANRPEILEVEPEEEVDTDEKGQYILKCEVEKAINPFTAIVDLSRSNFSIARAPLFQLKSAT